jgi:Repeat of unknown function (DUF5650)/Secretion system C-terminal sorting domain
MSNLKFILLLLLAVQASAQTINITGPAGSGQFGKTVTVLTNGNYVVTDPYYDEGGIADIGAVYLYNGVTNAVISVLKGSTANDKVGYNGVTALTNGNFVVSSEPWNNGFITYAGAVTWGNGVTGISGIVNSANSLVGSKNGDAIGAHYLVALPNGNYVVQSWQWDNGSIIDAGAVTWCNGFTGTSGEINVGNSLVGSHTNDMLGYGGVFDLPNGNYIVQSWQWSGNAGAVTWGNGATGTFGVVSSSNSLVGKSSDKVGLYGVRIFSNSNYVVHSPFWRNGTKSNAGAVTWGSGISGVSGIVSNINSLVGSSVNDSVGSLRIIMPTNDFYLVSCPNWDNGTIANAGSMTWGSSTAGISGIIGSSNSLVGSSAGDAVGAFFDGLIWDNRITLLSNGNYIIHSKYWDNGVIKNAGAVTWCSGVTGKAGVINSSNSLVGSTTDDSIGNGGIKALSNGNFVICSKYWDNGLIVNAGAVTWGNGTIGITGVINSSNSLVGSKANDCVGLRGTTSLSNGNYVAVSPNYTNGTIVNAGAVTWGNGTIGITGEINAGNSLVGSSTNDMVGDNGVIALNNGHYVAISSNWTNGSLGGAGAVTWADGNSGLSGTVTNGNSLVGSFVNDHIGSGGVICLVNGNYVISSPNYQSRGAVTWSSGVTGIIGVINSSNSLVGSNLGDQLGSGGIIALNNGNYVISSPSAINARGASAWGNGNTGIVGILSSSNSLVGSTAFDHLGSLPLIVLRNGNYVLRSPDWDNGAIADAGAYTWVNGLSGITGVLNSSNSLIGSTAADGLGFFPVNDFNYGNYILRNPTWDNGPIMNAGAVTLGNGSTGVAGIVTVCNSITGTMPSGGSSMSTIYNYIYDNLIVGRPAENIVSIYNPSGMAVASAQDSITVTINGTSAIPLITSNGCHIIATLTPNGVSPVNGALKAKVWVEPAVPVYVDDPFVSRHYEITPAANAATATGRITLYFTQQEFDDFNNHAGSVLNLPNNDGDAMGIANLRVGKYAGSSNNNSGLPGTYAGAPSIIDPNDTDVVWNSNLNRWEISFEVTGFSGFVVQTKATALPLQLLNFSAMLIQNDAVLTWKTTGETNTQSFEVLRSTDGQSFTKVGTVAAINNPIDQTYNYTDAGAGLLKTSKLYYRLKLVDKDGSYNNSLIVMLHLSKNNHVTVYPNPVNNIAVLSFSNSSLIGTIAVLTDMLGKKLQQFTISNYQQPVNMSQLATGMYILKLKDGTTVKLIKN